MYVELNGIHQYITRNSAGNAELRVREDCTSGNPQVTEMKCCKRQSANMNCFPPSSLNYYQSRHIITEEKMLDMYTMYSRFMPPERWPAYVQSHLQPIATTAEQTSWSSLCVPKGSQLHQKNTTRPLAVMDLDTRILFDGLKITPQRCRISQHFTLHAYQLHVRHLTFLLLFDSLYHKLLKSF